MARAQTAIEERWNVITHAVGILLTIIGAILLTRANHNQTNNYIQIAIWVYISCQLVLYTASTYYHRAAVGSRKDLLRKIDHIAIYLSIAGTYTPICLLILHQSNGWLILYSVWSIALFGVIWKLFFTGKFESFSSILYLFMGWLIVFDLPNLSLLFTDSMMAWLIAGGLSFTIGIIFYAWNKLNFNHVIWHLFVLAGSISHFIMIYQVIKSQ